MTPTRGASLFFSQGLQSSSPKENGATKKISLLSGGDGYTASGSALLSPPPLAGGGSSFGGSGSSPFVQGGRGRSAFVESPSSGAAQVPKYTLLPCTGSLARW